MAPPAPRGAGETRAGIVASVRAPLGFYVVCLLIVESMLTITLASGFEQDAKFSGILLEALLFIIVVFLFTHLVIFHAKNLTFRSEDYLRSQKSTGKSSARVSHGLNKGEQSLRLMAGGVGSCGSVTKQ